MNAAWRDVEILRESVGKFSGIKRVHISEGERQQDGRGWGGGLWRYWRANDGDHATHDGRVRLAEIEEDPSSVELKRIRVHGTDIS